MLALLFCSALTSAGVLASIYSPARLTKDARIALLQDELHRAQAQIRRLEEHSKALDAYAGLRPARHWPSLADRTPFAPGRAEGADVMVLREMCGGVMFAEPRGHETRDGQRYAFDTAGYGEAEVRRGEDVIPAPGPDLVLHGGDRLIVEDAKSLSGVG